MKSSPRSGHWLQPLRSHWRWPRRYWQCWLPRSPGPISAVPFRPEDSNIFQHGMRSQLPWGSSVLDWMIWQLPYTLNIYGNSMVIVANQMGNRINTPALDTSSTHCCSASSDPHAGGCARALRSQADHFWPWKSACNAVGACNDRRSIRIIEWIVVIPWNSGRIFLVVGLWHCVFFPDTWSLLDSVLRTRYQGCKAGEPPLINLCLGCVLIPQ